MKNRNILLAIFCCALASCSFNKVPPSDIYTILPDFGKSSSSTTVKKKNRPVIKLAPIRASRAFTGTDMVYVTTQYEQNSYAYSRWSDAPVTLLPLLFQTALEATGSFWAVISPPSAAKADFLLESTLTDFSHHVHDGNIPEGIISIRFYLINAATKTVIATREFRSQVPSSTPNAGDGATALNQAADTVAHDLAAWLKGMQL